MLKFKMAASKPEILIITQLIYTRYMQNSNGYTHVFKVQEFKEATLYIVG